MADTMNHNLILGRFIENQVRVGSDDNSPQTAFARELTSVRVLQ